MDILIVDDEAPARLRLIQLLAEVPDHRIVGEAEDGAQALAMCSAHAVDVVLLDVKMPGMDGMETLTRIKQAHPRTEVIMLTGHANVDVAIRGMEQGAFDYLMKPAEMDDLYYKIQDAHKKIQLADNG